MRVRSPWPTFLLLSALLSACDTGRSVVGGPLLDVPDSLDAPDVPSPLDAPDVPAPIDTPDVPDVPPAPIDLPPLRCTADADCVGSAAGPACDIPSGLCVACTAASDRCPAGQYCVVSMHRCAAGCRDDAACASASDAGVSATRCDPTSHACVACLTDAHCPTGTLCVGNTCVVGCTSSDRCPTGHACCSGACVDPQSNVAHCGACDRVCSVPNGSPACRNALCAVGACTAPFADCDGLPSNGCEVDTASSADHCGACNRPCAARPHATARCSGAACAYTCETGFADCDGDTTNGCEADTRTSTDHCGACTNRCAIPNATAACVAGSCAIAACTTGRANCNADLTDGCEAATATDATHCGACGTVCPEVGGARRCIAGSCSARNCAAVLSALPGATSGPYLLDLDGDGPSVARIFSCDMRDGGWTIVANQVPAELLADVNDTVGETVFGQLDHSWRLGNPDITRVRPTVAWRLSDELTNAYVVPACIVDWSRNYTDVMFATECTIGYTTPALNVVLNGAWVYCSARGIGINNTARHCSIRMNEGGFGRAGGALANGRAYTCDYNTVRRVSLAFR